MIGWKRLGSELQRESRCDFLERAKQSGDRSTLGSPHPSAALFYRVSGVNIRISLSSSSYEAERQRRCFRLAIKDVLRKAGIVTPCIAALTTDHIGYILTKEEYTKSGYEATTSFYGDGLGQLILDEVSKLGTSFASTK